jgi:hypothetical protein
MSGLVYVLTLLWWIAVIAFVVLVIAMSVKVLRSRRRGGGSNGPEGGRNDRVSTG